MFKNPITPLFLLVVLVCNQSYSQNEVKGKIVSTGAPVAYANVVLLNAQDSVTFYKGAISDEEGNFILQDIASDDYLLQVSFVGYQEYQKKINVDGNASLNTIQLQEASSDLDEVTITTRKPKIIKEVDRLVFDVENSTLSTGSTWDILRSTPGVIQVQGDLLVKNEGVAVYINDRQVQLTSDELRTLLESYSAANIKSIEVITNPPARYEAEGGAVLNINTSKALTPGYKGSVEGNYTQAIYPKYQFGTSHYFKTDKLNVFANYSFSPRKEIKQDDSHINFRNDNGDIFSRWNTDFDRVTRSRAHNANAILDYYLDDKNTLSFTTNIMISPNIDWDNNVYSEFRDAQRILDSTLVTDSNVETDQKNIAFDLQYTHDFDSGAQFSAKGHFTTYDQDRLQMVNSDYFDAAGNFIQNINFNTDANQEIEIYTAQADFTSALGEASFESGLKLSSINSESAIDYFDTATLRIMYDNLSDEFLYDEKVYAAYASIARDWENWSFKGGLRGEYTDLEGNSLSMNEVNSQEYVELFPTAYLQYQVSANHSFTFDYSRRISRPDYNSLNPFRYFLNENDFNAGNPNLRASISNNFNLNYSLKNQYFFDLYYRDYGRSPEVLSFQDNISQNLRRVSVNLLGSVSYGIDFLHGRSITSFWYAQAYTSVFHDENTFVALESDNQEVTNEVDGFYGQLYNSFTLSKDGTFSGTLTGVYISDFISGSYQLEPMAILSVGLRKSLWNNRAVLTVNIEDILNRTNTRLTSRYLNQDNSYLAQEETQYVRVGFKYNFGNFRLSDNERQIEAAERDRL
ncbi:outer membrane beta-barrel family protein [Salegentibacter sp. F188]|uniref:Outer membrane beta-barrel family protein n=1 Tax=Autumnicola patrickiae TaxID=3075591 RepID=A0ABU3E5B9_9FLAO|nr:outer membrane beta-barrel family protein [Salegentibacter sp. F188]MDT0690432.1 outer membrane beta-barrel family protein [Salegentibacter sp. F188]